MTMPRDASAQSSLWLPPSEFARTDDQSAVFGRFCVNAGSFPQPPRIERRLTEGYQIYHFRRAFFGLPSPITSVLIERRPTAETSDLWRAADAAVATFADRPPPDIIKLFIAEPASPLHAVGPDLKQTIAGAYCGVFFPRPLAETIELPRNYETFLRNLGNHTRRDMRRFRRKAEGAGVVFEFRMAVTAGAADRHALGHASRPKRFSGRLVDAYDTFIAAQDRGFHATLRAASGELLSCCGGFRSDNSTFLLYQLNHRAYPKAALSLTNRSYLIERLIEDGMRELILPGGIVGLLSPACQVRHGGELILIRRSPAAMAKALTISLARPSSLVGEALRRLRRPAGSVSGGGP